MEEFNTLLVREKITFTDAAPEEKGGAKKKPVVVRSNRIFLKLHGAFGEEKIVIRAQNMHTTLRFAAMILRSYYDDGIFLARKAPFDWEAEWKGSLSFYEGEYNTNIWAAVYINGKPVFRTLSSPFVDVIEKSAALTVDNYTATMQVTEKSLQQLGHTVRIEHSANISTTFSDTGKMTFCSILNRQGGKDTTFDFKMTGKDQHKRVLRSMGIAAAYLELFNLRFIIRDLQEKKRSAPEDNRLQAALMRQTFVNEEIASQSGFFTPL